MHSTSSVSEVFNNTKTLNTNSVSEVKNTNTKHKPQTKTITQVRVIAQRLCDGLNNQSRFEYYCKLAWHLPDSVIFTNLEVALTGRNPQRYFSFLCDLTMKEQQSQ
jgi:hypothetical protein